MCTSNIALEFENVNFVSVGSSTTALIGFSVWESHGLYSKDTTAQNKAVKLVQMDTLHPHWECLNARYVHSVHSLTLNIPLAGLVSATNQKCNINI